MESEAGRGRPETTAQVYGFTLSKWLMVALGDAVSHAATTLGGTLRLWRG